jgi:D-arginine dehydrogenase
LLAEIRGLRPEWSCGAFHPYCAEFDVAALHQHYLAVLRRCGAEIRCSAGLIGADRTTRGWSLELADGSRVDAAVLINAAGAWADPVAALAGVRTLGITPYRRTVAQVRTAPSPPAALPLVLDLDEHFYFKPEAGRLWLSPHDETPTAPLDAAPEELDVALAIDRFEHVTDWKIEAVEHNWAGLRSFAPDRLPVYGFAADEPAFFWFAGQGGFGIQTAPAAADLAARLVLGREHGEVDPGRYAPSRFA